MKRLVAATAILATLTCAALSATPTSAASPYPTTTSACAERTAPRLRALAAADDTLRAGPCVAPYYVEPAVPARRAATEATGAAVRPLTDTFTLSSRPAASRTIYLDFTGRTVTGTPWNSTYGASLVAAPFSITAPADTDFSDAELTEIQTAWAIVAEDYAPFDVNVTTEDPGRAALERSSRDDTRYGVRVLVTNSGTIFTRCGCGGLAYVGTFGAVSGSDAPAWVFSAGTGATGKGVGEAAAHEVGHTLGLHHDGVGARAYATGETPWAPIMGAGYYQPLTQWSSGEYASATNTEDDLAIIGARLPLLDDDHGDTATTATALDSGVAGSGLITTRSDVDAFTIDASGSTTVTVSTPRGSSDLDVGLEVRGATGRARTVAAGAGWTAALPTGTATRLTLLVDGVGAGDGSTLAAYSDYASLGAYTITVATDARLSLAGLTVRTRRKAPVTRRLAATGGTGTYAYRARGLPGGVRLDTRTGRLSGAAKRTGRYVATVRVTSGTEVTTAPVVFVVTRAR